MLMSMSNACIIHPPSNELGSVAEGIMRALPAWFGIEEGIVAYTAAADRMPTLLATVDDVPVGFMTIERHFSSAAELHVLGVLESHHRQGVGGSLLRATEAWLADDGCRWLQVKTVSSDRQCPAYAKSRAWYKAMGFEPLQVFPLLWDEANPALQLVKRLD